MLDTSRNYFTVDSIKRTLIGMAHSKLNRFHWHITDSQSFPYVSKSYPQLSQYGAYSSKEIYTSEDIREVADFARVRGIQVYVVCVCCVFIKQENNFACSVLCFTFRFSVPFLFF